MSDDPVIPDYPTESELAERCLPSALRKEIDKLKSDWLRDPCWDLGTMYAADDPVYGPFVKELVAFEDKQRQLWVNERERRLSAKALDLGCPGNHKLAAYVERLEDRLEKLAEFVARLDLRIDKLERYTKGTY